MAEKSEVASFYENRSVFITGASGFMGKVLLEKLLYSCPGIRTLYILIRPKRGKLPDTRIREMFKLPAFERIRKECPEQMKKVVPIVGELSAPDLGLSPKDMTTLLKEVEIVFHCAATLKLEACLKDSITINLIGTWNVLELCKNMKQLKVLIHFSTAFCFPDLHELEEKIYPAPFNPHDIINCTKWMDEESLEKITSNLLGCHPNTYTFTKRLSETLVSDSYKDITAVIVRPAVVTPSYKEPVPGWVDSLNGPIGITVGAGKGVIRSMYCQPDHHAHVIPVDAAIRMSIAAASKVASLQEKPLEIPVYNLTLRSVHTMTWREILEKGKKFIWNYPFEMTIWYPDGDIRTSKLLHNIYVLLFQFLPAYFIDFIMLLIGQKQFMVFVQKRIRLGMSLLQYFTNREWVIHHNKYLAFNKMIQDESDFHADLENVNVDQYLLDTLLGARQYCMKEQLTSLPRCRRNIRILYALDILVKSLVFLFLIWTIFSLCQDKIEEIKTPLNFMNRSIDLINEPDLMARGIISIKK